MSTSCHGHNIRKWVEKTFRVWICDLSCAFPNCVQAKPWINTPEDVNFHIYCIDPFPSFCHLLKAFPVHFLLPPLIPCTQNPTSGSLRTHVLTYGSEKPLTSMAARWAQRRTPTQSPLRPSSLACPPSSAPSDGDRNWRERRRRPRSSRLLCCSISHCVRQEQRTPQHWESLNDRNKSDLNSARGE